eukprot:403362881
MQPQKIGNQEDQNNKQLTVVLLTDTGFQPIQDTQFPSEQDNKRLVKGDSLDINLLLPQVNVKYQGHILSYYFLILIASMDTVRSFIHILSEDGGAYSIAGIVLQGDSGQNVVSIFAQWGGTQILLAILYWLAILKYDFLTPFMLLVLFLEQTFRFIIGAYKPFVSEHAAPGGVATYILVPLSIIFLLLSISKQQ